MSDKPVLQSSATELVVETETLRTQALAQLREWIEKDPNIVKCRTDDAFLLRFLRVKKFRIPDAYQLLVNYLSLRKIKPHFFENLNAECPKLKYYIDNHFTYVLPKPDKYGRLVLVIEYNRVDVKKCDPIDVIRYGNLNIEYLCQDERSQLVGAVYVTDWTGLSMSFTSLLTPTFIKEISSCWFNSSNPLRNNMNLYINMPPFMKGIFLLFTSLLNEKLKSRFKIVQSYKEIEDEIGVEILPKEYGGEVPAADIGKLHKQRLIEVRDDILSINTSLDIKISKSSTAFGNTNDAKLDSEIVGSFRKIEVD